MPTEFLKGDLFEDPASVGPRALAFAADCSGAMDRGVAVAFAKRWPALAEAYRQHAAGGKMQPGDVFAWQDEDVRVYALGLLQGEKKPKVSALTRALEAMLARASADGVARVALPRIAALDPSRVKRVLTDVGERSVVTLAMYEQFVRRATGSG